jgi:hypothetical protein
VGPAALPWLVPVPLRRASFRPVFAAHERFAVVIDGGRIPAFGATLRPPDGPMAYCDLRAHAVHGTVAAIGAARSGFFAGWHLDGIGATTLAREPTPPHLDATAAIRTLVLDTWVASRCRDALLPCEGVLLDEAGSGAIAIRRGPFTRFSNLVWLADRLDFFRHGGDTFVALPKFLRIYLAHVGDRPPIDPSARTIAEVFFGVFERALGNVEAVLRLGLPFDLRPDDIDTRGTLLALRPASSPVAASSLVAHFRGLAWFFRTRFAAIAVAPPPITPAERTYAAAIAHAFADEDQLLYDDTQLQQRFAALGIAGLDPNPDLAALDERLADHPTLEQLASLVDELRKHAR